MMTVKFQAGTRIDDAATKLVVAAREHGDVTGTFNGIALRATKGSTVASILRDWETQSRAQAEAYRASSEGIAAAARRDAEQADLQQRHDALMARLPLLNMKDDSAVLDWLCQMQAPSDRIGVIVRRQTIVAKFEAAGFRAGENTGVDFRPGSGNVFRWLVGQALDGLKNGPAIHGIIHKFAAEWRRDFDVPALHVDPACVVERGEP